VEKWLSRALSCFETASGRRLFAADRGRPGDG
jgi:hypothetical protein